MFATAMRKVDIMFVSVYNIVSFDNVAVSKAKGWSYKMKSLLPPLRLKSSAKLFAFGAMVGPVVDSFHNQCLLRYDFAPITIPWPEALSSLSAVFEQEYLLCSSWSVPILLGVAYVVLGDILPRLFQWLLDSAIPNQSKNVDAQTVTQSSDQLRTKAILAVLTTILIIKASQYLELHQPLQSVPFDSIPFVETSAQPNYAILLLAAIIQWLLLDGTVSALLASAITSIGGPLSELFFVANGCWHYVTTAADYYPLASVPDTLGLLSRVLGENYQQLALSSITGPCYFAVTMDAIALGRWFQSTRDK